MPSESIITIANRTGFSASTVSRVLNGREKKYRISEKTAEIILAEAKRCGYSPNPLAKGLRTNRTFTIGLIIPSIDNPYFAEIANGIISRAKRHGYTVMAVDTMENERNEADAVSLLTARKVDGLIVATAGRNPSLLERTRLDGTPVILIDRHFENSDLPYVSSDNFGGGYAATKYLIEQGHKRILCIRGLVHSMPSRLRVQGYLTAMKECLPEIYIDIAGDDFSIEDGYKRTAEAIGTENPPTAIFALSNTIALGAIKAIHEKGMSIPEDISLISFDDSPYLDFMSPAVTRIAQPTELICEEALSRLLREIQNETLLDEEKNIALPTEMLIRDSVARITSAQQRVSTYPQ